MRLKPRFSLRSLLLAVLTLAAAAALHRNFAPWRVERELLGVTTHCHFLSVSSDGKWIIASHETRHPTDSTPNHFYYKNFLWNAETGEGTVLHEHSMNHSPWFGHDGAWLSTGLELGNPSLLKMIHLQTRLERTFPTDRDYLLNDFSPDNRHLLTEVYGESIRVFELESGKEVFKAPHGAHIFSKSGKELAVVHPDGFIAILETASGRELKRIPRPTDWEFFTLRYFSDSLLIAEALQTEHYWESRFRGVSLCFDLAHPDLYEIARGELQCISKDESRAIFCEGDQCTVSEGRTWKPVCRLEEASGTFTFVEEGARVLDLTRLAAMDAETGKLIYKLEYAAFALVSPDESRLVVTDFNTKSVRIYDAKTGERLATLPQERCYFFQQSFMPDSERFITQNYDTHAIHLWRRYRPEHTLGFLWLPEFWLTLALSAALGWSLRRDWRERKSAAISGTQTLA